jgi:hypothetical protein
MAVSVTAAVKKAVARQIHGPFPHGPGAHGDENDEDKTDRRLPEHEALVNSPSSRVFENGQREKEKTYSAETALPTALP